MRPVSTAFSKRPPTARSNRRITGTSLGIATASTRPHSAARGTELAPEDLAGHGLRKLVDDFELPGVLVRSKAITSKADQLIWRGPHPGTQHHKSLDRLAAIVVRRPD